MHDAVGDAPLTFRLESLRAEEGEPHVLHGIVWINGWAHYVVAWEVVDEAQRPHPGMGAEMAGWYADVTRATSPDRARTVIGIPGWPGRWVVVVRP